MQKLAYSISESEDIAGCKKDRLYAEINAGNLKSIKVGRRRLIRAAALEQWLKDLESKTSKAMGFGDTPE